MSDTNITKSALCDRCNGRGRVPENRGKRSVPVSYTKPCPKCDPQMIIRRKNAAARKAKQNV